MAESSTGRRQRILRTDEARLFRDIMGDVRPFEHVGAAPEAEDPPEPPPQPAQPLITIRTAETPVGSRMARDLDASTATRLRQGKIPIDARLDLHGLTQDEALAALTRLIEDGYRQGRRCLLVITGKGRRDDGQGGLKGGILKTAVPRWLNGPALAPMVLATATAKPDHGGDGALYVLVRRNRALG